MSDRLTGALGEARRLPAERLDPHRQGAVVATIDYWWIDLPSQPLLIAHAGAIPDDIGAVSQLEVLTPKAGEGMTTFALGLITLAQFPGVRAANKLWPWMTHELMVHTIDTTRGPVPFDAPFPWVFMDPHNVSVQFQVDDDHQACRVAEQAAWGIINGILPPDTQAYVPERKAMVTLEPLWARWQETISATAEHERTAGTHTEGHDR